MKTPLDDMAPAACVCYGAGAICICPATERALRHIVRGSVPMSEQRRAWCLTEIGSFEGQRSFETTDSDADVARGVLDAWVDYARDKGLL